LTNIDKFMDVFLTGDYLVIFLFAVLVMIIVLIIALIKTKDEVVYVEKPIEKEDKIIEKSEESILDDLDLLKATTNEDIINEDEPLIKQINIPNIKTYEDIIDEYESEEEEDAIISASDLEKVKNERMEKLGVTNSKIAIEKYEEEQENKAIISYEQLLKNAQNITLTYKEEPSKNIEAPKINKIEIEQKEISAPENYLEEEEFLKILKSFRMSL